MRFLFHLAAGLLLGACTELTLDWAPLEPKGAPAHPPALGAFAGEGPVETVEQWETIRAPRLRAAFERHVYGAGPDAQELVLHERRLLDPAAFGGAGALWEYRLQAAFRFGEETRRSREFYMNVVTPKADKSAPIILVQSFCPRHDALPHPAVSNDHDAPGCSGGMLEGLVTYVFGRYIARPPIEEILARGYALGVVYPSEFAPDNRTRGRAELARLAAGAPPESAAWGTVIAWASGFSLMVDALQRDAAHPPRAIIAYGHSRYAKSALVAAAYDARIDAVMAHQSGTGGASLNRDKPGESVKAITKSYPHWFAQNYAAFAGREEEMPVDQHQLLALIAPRPVLLGNARRDVWSDPNGAFRAAEGADPVYQLYGRAGLDQTRLDDWRPDAALAFWLRPGTHGVVEEDWPAFLEFLDAHFGG